MSLEVESQLGPLSVTSTIGEGDGSDERALRPLCPHNPTAWLGRMSIERLLKRPQPAFEWCLGDLLLGVFGVGLCATGWTQSLRICLGSREHEAAQIANALHSRSPPPRGDPPPKGEHLNQCKLHAGGSHARPSRPQTPSWMCRSYPRNRPTIRVSALTPELTWVDVV